MKTELKNKKYITVEGFEIWDKPSIATTTAICGKDKIGNFRFIFERRGSGCPDGNGKLCFPCGYLDKGDRIVRFGAARELFEETGIRVEPIELHPVGISDGPDTNLGNITYRFLYYVPDGEIENIYNQLNKESSSRGGEKDEVAEFLLLDLEDVISRDSEKEELSEFCYKHGKFTKEIVENIDAILKNQYYSDYLTQK